MRIALVQMDVVLAQTQRNLEVMLAKLREARQHGAELVIFPECALTGYCFDDLAEARPHAQPVPGPATEAFVSVLRDIGGTANFGMVESSANGIFNVSVLVSAAGVQAVYRKIHLPFLGLDRFAVYGNDAWAVHDVVGNGGAATKVGMAICYDSAFPESIRALSLMGADLIALPTNFPAGAEGMVDHVIRTRALENKVYFACCNRVGEERGYRFIGGSQIIDPSGKVLTRAGTDEETILYADINPQLARDKRVIRPPGLHALDRHADRRPEMYKQLIVPHALPRPRDDQPTR